MSGRNGFAFAFAAAAKYFVTRQIVNFYIFTHCIFHNNHIAYQTWIYSYFIFNCRWYICSETVAVVAGHRFNSPHAAAIGHS